ncbi:integrase [Mycobacteroides abscessus]|nr:integrase [Mycobacteroides abscessus]
MIVAVLSGLRAGALFGLQRKHVDLIGRTVRVEQSLAREERDAPRFASTKTELSKRTVHLPREALAVLREQSDQFVPTGRDALVFGTARGTPLGSGSRSKMFSRACASVGRDDVTWHDLRHSALQMWAATGATIPELMAVAGHSSSKSAMHYQHIAAGAQQRLAERMDTMLSAPQVVRDLRPDLTKSVDRLAS